MRNIEGCPFSPAVFHLHWGSNQNNNVRQRSKAIRLKEGGKTVSTQSSEITPSSTESTKKLLK